MASPSVSNISQLSASDANTWNSGQVGNANAAIPSADLAVSTDGINPPNTCQQFEGSSVGYTSGNKYSAYSPSWTAVNISGANQAILLHFAGNPAQFNQVSTDSDGLTIYGFDSGAARTTDYLYIELGGSDDKFYRGAANFFPVLLFSANATAEGSIDDTDIVEIGTAYKAGATGQFGVQFRIDQIVYINGEVSFDDGDGTTVGTWARYRALLEPEAATGSVYNGANIQVKPFYGFGHPVRMNCENFADSNFTFAFLPQDSDAAFNPPSSGYYSLSINPSSSTATHAYTDGVFAYDSGTYPLDIDASSATSGSLNFTRCSFLNTGAVSLDGANLTMSACTFSSPVSFTMQDADLDIAINNCSAPIQWTADLAAGSTIATDSDIDITFLGTDLSDINLVLTAELTISVDPTGASQTYDLSGITTSNVLRLWNKDTANATTVTVPSGITTEKIDLWFNYDNEASGPFVEQELLTFGNGATATLRVLVDNGTTGTMYCTLVSGSAPPDNNSITGGTSSATANVNEASGANNSTLTISQTAVTFTFTSDTASTLIRYFDDDSQTITDSTTGTSLAYNFTGSDPVDVEFLKQGYVPVNRQDIVPTDGGSLDIIMDLDEAYNSSHGLVITTDYTYNRATKALAIVADQEALDVRSALADLIRTNSSYYNTPLLMVAIPGLTRVDLTNGMTISSMATWKGAGMERFDAADALNPVEKWFAIKSVGNITGATAYYRQTSSGNATAVSLTSNVLNEAFQYWSDPNHDGSTADGYDYSGYMVIKAVLAGSKEARVDVIANAGLSAIASNLYTVPLANTAGGYSGTDPGVTANLTLIAGGTEGGETFAYEWVDGATTSAEDIANQIHYNKVNIPNSTIAGGTGLTWWEIPDSVVFNGSNVETARGYEEGASPAIVGFYVSRGGVDHPGFTRFQADNGNYYTPAENVLWTAANFLNDTRVRLYNVTQAVEIDNSVVSGGGGYSYTLVPSTDFDSGDQITMLATYQVSGVAKQVFRFSTTVTTADIAITDSQVDWDNPGPNTLAIDGSTVSECATDYVGVQVEVTDADDTTQKSRIAAFIVDALTTEDGIRNWVALDGSSVITYSTNSAAQIDADVAEVEIYNAKAASILSIKDSFEFDWSDGVDRVSTVTGSSIIWIAPDRVLLQAIGSGVTAGDKTDIIDGVHNKVIENSESFLQTTRLIRAAVVGESTVSGTTYTFRDAADSKARITATVDANGQRTSVTTDAT